VEHCKQVFEMQVPGAGSVLVQQYPSVANMYVVPWQTKAEGFQGQQYFDVYVSAGTSHGVLGFPACVVGT
jgi:hypothetical protein